MNATIEITMYPLRTDYEDQVLHFLSILRKEGDFEINVNAMSTQVKGDYRLIFSAIQAAIEAVYSDEIKAAFVLKVLPGALNLKPDFTGLYG